MTMPDKIVYSTDPDWKPPCPPRTFSAGIAAKERGKPRQAEPVRVSFRRGHKGSGMTIIERLRIHPAGKDELLKKFKKRLGVGGTVKLARAIPNARLMIVKDCGHGVAGQAPEVFRQAVEELIATAP